MAAVYTAHHPATLQQALFTIFVRPALSRTTRPPTSFLRTLYTETERVVPKAPPKKQNHSITAQYIHLEDEATNTTRLLKRDEVLSSINLKTHKLVQLSPDETGPKNPFSSQPRCRIVDKKADYLRQKSLADKKKESRKVQSISGNAGLKTMELNWAMGEHDLEHRMRKVKNFLEEGRRVEVVLASKKRGRRASDEESEAVVKRIQEVLDSVQGASSGGGGMKGKVGGFATWLLVGRPVTVGDLRSKAGGQEGEGAEGVEGRGVEGHATTAAEGAVKTPLPQFR